MKELTEAQIAAATGALLIETNATGSVMELSEQARRVVEAALEAGE